MPIAWKGTVVQYAGRLHRAYPGKRDALIYDYVDAELPVLRRMFAKRLRAYRALGYELAQTDDTSTPPRLISERPAVTGDQAPLVICA
jgi:superfamily II DNA or RNA helicase